MFLVRKWGFDNMQILKVIWDFFQNQILGMKWLNELIGSGLNALGFNTTNR